MTDGPSLAGKEVVVSNGVAMNDQTIEDKLCLRLIGKSVEDNPGEVFQRLSQDHLLVLQKYGLTPVEDQQDMVAYASALESMAAERGIKVRRSRKLSGSGLGGGFVPPDILVMPEIDLNTCQPGEAMNYAIAFGHEYIHALQYADHGLNRDSEVEEYEAYVAMNWPMYIHLAMKQQPVEAMQTYIACVSIMEDINKSVESFNRRKIGEMS